VQNFELKQLKKVGKFTQGSYLPTKIFFAIPIMTVTLWDA